MAASSPVTISQGFLSRLFTGSANRTANDPANTAFHGFAPSVLTVACEATFAAHYRRRWRRSSTMYEVAAMEAFINYVRGSHGHESSNTSTG